MIQVIFGKKGSGKTKRIIDMTNNLYNPSFRTSAFLTVRSQFNYNFMPVYSFF